ncbi:MAG: hypothetical protein WCG92_07130 [Hyphomicrobiales bacterium]
MFQDSRRTASVRARTKVELLSVGQGESKALGSVLRAFGEAMGAPPRSDGAAAPR